ncbi:hypothetical protein D9M72_514980 [compost metagenome]
MTHLVSNRTKPIVEELQIDGVNLVRIDGGRFRLTDVVDLKRAGFVPACLPIDINHRRRKRIDNDCWATQDSACGNITQLVDWHFVHRVVEVQLSPTHRLEFRRSARSCKLGVGRVAVRAGGFDRNGFYDNIFVWQREAVVLVIRFFKKWSQLFRVPENYLQS